MINTEVAMGASWYDENVDLNASRFIVSIQYCEKIYFSHVYLTVQLMLVIVAKCKQNRKALSL